MPIESVKLENSDKLDEGISVTDLFSNIISNRIIKVMLYNDHIALFFKEKW